jgi:hypothetical protein
MTSQVNLFKKSYGRKPQTSVWTNFLNEKPYQLKEVTCKHCNQIISTSMKIRLAIKHLNSCVLFKTQMNTIEECNIPEWFIPEPSHKKQKTMLNYIIPEMSAQEQDNFDLKCANFFFTTETPFSRASHQSFKEMLQASRPNINIPTRFRISGD